MVVTGIILEEVFNMPGRTILAVKDVDSVDSFLVSIKEDKLKDYRIGDLFRFDIRPKVTVKLKNGREYTNQKNFVREMERLNNDR